ncbi:amino acid/amide ABC transporter substrate-binding protein, HAAT family [Micromonospora echinaurantiaca]|uniref:Amino acid/amide ABC transporter substrate-binding protein, HAAT family n=1 Tax=Micromonospora echinaurantiaca TaxID=47857 RepID=A0A1C5HYZ2_9ACTN|nr:ABC transporter substrate-binding protein [Micromonospora echinaurantiaca]SCG51127.1 amino acid/amide ABC transporter substrate-binding protein, HAAT family [Micromonospora echinaurantiaca]
MALRTSRTALGVALILLAGTLTACRGGDSTTDESGLRTDVGVTAEPCPDAVDRNKGCIYLGIISDLTEGPFRALAVPITDAQKAFWKRVNTAGGIGDYEVDVTRYVRDNKYNPQTHNQVYQQIKPNVLALAQSLGSPTTGAILGDMKASSVIAAPAAWTSGYAFEDVIIESGANYCVESMNALDYAREAYAPKSVMAVHLAGDYGDDAAAGVKLAAQTLGMTFTDVKTDSGADKQAGAIQAILAGKPDLVVLTMGPADAATIVGQAVARGFAGRFIGTSPTWNPALLQSPAAPALLARYEQTAPWNTWSTDTPGHRALREALPGVTPNDGYTSGWVWSYPMKAALAKAVADGDLTRAGLLKAVKSLTSVDYEGMLPATAGNYAAGANEGAVRVTAVYKPDKASPTGVSQVRELFTGPTAGGYNLDRPCYEKL